MSIWSSDWEFENEMRVIWVQRIYRSRLNFSETEVSYEYADMFRLTSAKIEELSIVGPFFFSLENELKLCCK